MDRKRQIEELMVGIRDAHREFQSEWARVKARTQGPTSPPSETSPHDIEPSAEKVEFLLRDLLARDWNREIEINRIAYAECSHIAERRDRLYGELIEVIGYQNLEHRDRDDLNATLDFLEVDVRAFRCGYLKQRCLRKLRRLPLALQNLSAFGIYSSHIAPQRESGGSSEIS